MTTYGVDWSQHRFYKKDPLPGITPALLNSHDITRYVEKECLLEKDRFDPKRMKPASYEMKFLGTLYDWEVKDGKKERRCREIVEGKGVKLSRNSISYLWIEETLRLPEYIAARFNLRISDVHKGILLGTGPLIDPGFGGRILIPLHNLTGNNYILRGGQGIIWVEFTKVSKNCCWLPDQEGNERPSGLVEFPSKKAIDDPDAYLYKAGTVAGVQSAYKEALESTMSAADAASAAAAKASNRADEFDTRMRTFGFVGLIAVVVGVAALVLSAFVLMFSVYDFRGQIAESVHRQSERIHELETVLEELKADSNASGVAEEAGVPGPSGLGVEEAVSSQEGMESEEGDDPLASGRGTLPERRESPAPRIR